MSRTSFTRLLAALMLVALAGSGHADQKVHTVHVTGPTVIGYVPSDTQSQRDDGSVEGIAHTMFALEDTNACLGRGRVRFEFVFADRIVVVNGKQSASLQVNKMEQGFGAVLVEPGRKLKVVFAEQGPSTLQYLLPNAASAYWAEPKCKQDG